MRQMFLRFGNDICDKTTQELLGKKYRGEYMDRYSVCVNYRIDGAEQATFGMPLTTEQIQQAINISKKSPSNLPPVNFHP